MSPCAALIADLAATTDAVIANSNQLRKKETLSVHMVGKSLAKCLYLWCARLLVDALIAPT